MKKRTKTPLRKLKKGKQMIQKYLARVLPRNSVFNSKSTLINFLADYGIKQKWLSKRMGLSEGMLSLLLHNKRTWQHSQVENCAKALGLHAKQVAEMIENYD